MRKENNIIDNPALGCALGRAYQILLSKLAKALNDANLDITAGEYLILRALYSRPGIQQCEIADMIGKDKAAVSRCVSGLEKKGLVSTELISHKCLKVHLTEKAMLIQPRIMAVAQLRHNELAGMTTDKELATFASILKRIIENQ